MTNMKNTRLIAKLDVKSSYLVKGIQFEGLRKLGEPHEFAKKYYDAGIDELIYLDIVASLYNRNNLSEIVKQCTKDIFVPLTVGGGIRCVEDAANLLESGADKIAINTAAIKNPILITEIADRFGSQCVVLSVQAKSVCAGKWEAYYDNGREKTGIDVVDWVKLGYELGAGEILITSVDKEGTLKGLDFELIKSVSQIVPVPVLACGGLSSEMDFVKAVVESKADAVVCASALHYNKLTVESIKDCAVTNGINVRRIM